MKPSILVLFGLISLFASGCAVTAFTGNPPPAGVEVTNNVAESFVTLHTSRANDLGVKLRTGETVKIPVCDLPYGGQYTVTAKFWDVRSGAYLGTAVQTFGVWFDQSGRYHDYWVLSGYQSPTQYGGGGGGYSTSSSVTIMPSSVRIR